MNENNSFSIKEVLRSAWTSTLNNYFRIMGFFLFWLVLILSIRLFVIFASAALPKLSFVFTLLDILISTGISLGFLAVFLKIIDGLKPKLTEFFAYYNITLVRYIMASIVLAFIYFAFLIILMIGGLFVFLDIYNISAAASLKGLSAKGVNDLVLASLSFKHYLFIFVAFLSLLALVAKTAFYPFVLIEDKKTNVMESLAINFSLTKGKVFFKVYALLLLILIFVVGFWSLGLSAFNLLFLSTGYKAGLVGFVVLGILFFLIAPFFCIWLPNIYRKLSEAKKGEEAGS